MARILGVDIPNDKRVVISLTYIFGIGKSTSQQILKLANIDENIRVKDLADEQIAEIRRVALNRFISWNPSPSWFTSAWTKNKNKRSYT